MYRTVAALAAIAVALAGCTANGDGSSTCRDFVGMSQDERAATVARMLKERNGLNSSTSEVQATAQRTLAFCGKDGNLDKPVGDAK
ncbi:hypothetical protein TUM20985_12680 [Mycobacterium antarcticum]|uniref:hypothetical protein n=1 Tax=unclassified Mycolicibacterium TaxID=2636767 RepID=UPI0023A3A064|nr:MULTISPECIES: hypothetical protein [unclassified Mycolicibacterium]BDX30721.1 hypothetical protein TUM20985_12680 [Mycolicibacterium sp. TUM20985]GLP74085.1 hypothetical protein TUM20983_11950 [Mycolicibacterium sp. TUM20983]GLP79869.1 hypothetical protein TUM20984_12890 [Mycolicibacterium sp. TUM20984]